MAFTGFTEECLRFIAENHLQNNTEWFHSHREVYDEVLMPQLKALVTELSPYMLSLDPNMEVTPKVSKTVSRINRDIRFSHNKAIYNDHFWIKFHTQGQENDNILGFYFGFHADTYGTGMGMYHLKEDFMAAFRNKLKTDEKGFNIAPSHAYPGKGLELGGDSYKKIKDAAVPQNLQVWSQFKEFHFHQSLPIDNLFFGAGLVDFILAEFEKQRPLYQYLKEIKNSLEG